MSAFSKSLAIGLCASVMLSSPAALAGDVTCFARGYGEEHLDRNPNQSIAYISLSLITEDGNKVPSWAFLTAASKGYDRRYFVDDGLYCQDSENGLWCGIECDGGLFKLVNETDETIDMVTHGVRTIGSGCGGRGEPYSAGIFFEESDPRYEALSALNRQIEALGEQINYVRDEKHRLLLESTKHDGVAYNELRWDEDPDDIDWDENKPTVFRLYKLPPEACQRPTSFQQAE